MSKEAETRQVGGDHYVNMGMQPAFFAMVNGWDADAFSCLKYVSRHRAKDGLEGVKKARHFIDLRLLHIEHALPNRRIITMGEYIRANLMVEDDALALMQLESWIDGRTGHLPAAQSIESLMKEYAGHQAELTL